MAEEEKGQKSEKKEKKKLTVHKLKETMKTPKEALEMRKQQGKIIKAIKGALKSGPKTIPQIAQEANLETHVVTYYLFSMRKYGEIADGEEEEGYPTFTLPQEESESKTKESEEESE
ncbi:MAG: hypothetical protein ACOC5L_02720 [Halobacteriota archaeon]